jgi:hypothetical protein
VNLMVLGMCLGIHMWDRGLEAVRGLPVASGGLLVGLDWVVLASAVT